MDSRSAYFLTDHKAEFIFLFRESLKTKRSTMLRAIRCSQNSNKTTFENVPPMMCSMQLKVPLPILGVHPLQVQFVESFSNVSKALPTYSCLERPYCIPSESPILLTLDAKLIQDQVDHLWEGEFTISPSSGDFENGLMKGLPAFFC